MAEKTATRARGTTGSGTAIIIGGHEDKKGDKVILKEIAKRVGNGKIVIATLASAVAEEIGADYIEVFQSLGIKNIQTLDIENRSAASDSKTLDVLEKADCVFFTGGDQLKITSKLGGTPASDRIRQIYAEGGIVAGTSAGASVMSETMLVSGEGAESHKVRGSVLMGPGLSYVRGLIIDQHFAQCGRIGRLLGAVAQNPELTGIGIDEDTAIIVEGSTLSVLGSGAVYIADARASDYSNVSDSASDKTMCMFNVRLHVLSEGAGFDLRTREPKAPPSS